MSVDGGMIPLGPWDWELDIHFSRKTMAQRTPQHHCLELMYSFLLVTEIQVVFIDEAADCV